MYRIGEAPRTWGEFNCACPGLLKKRKVKLPTQLRLKYYMQQLGLLGFLVPGLSDLLPCDWHLVATASPFVFSGRWSVCAIHDQFIKVPSLSPELESSL